MSGEFVPSSHKLKNVNSSSLSYDCEQTSSSSSSSSPLSSLLEKDHHENKVETTSERGLSLDLHLKSLHRKYIFADLRTDEKVVINESSYERKQHGLTQELLGCNLIPVSKMISKNVQQEQTTEELPRSNDLPTETITKSLTSKKRKLMCSEKSENLNNEMNPENKISSLDDERFNSDGSTLNYDSDTDSNIPSELFRESNRRVDVSDGKEQFVDLNQSLNICRNIKELSAHFSQLSDKKSNEEMSVDEQNVTTIETGAASLETDQKTELSSSNVIVDVRGLFDDADDELFSEAVKIIDAAPELTICEESVLLNAPKSGNIPDDGIFKYASGKEVIVSARALKRVENLMKDLIGDCDEECTNNLRSLKNTGEHTEPIGTGNKIIPWTEKNLDEIDETCSDVGESTKENNFEKRNSGIPSKLGEIKRKQAHKGLPITPKNKIRVELFRKNVEKNISRNENLTPEKSRKMLTEMNTPDFVKSFEVINASTPRSQNNNNNKEINDNDLMMIDEISACAQALLEEDEKHFDKSFNTYWSEATAKQIVDQQETQDLNVLNDLQITRKFLRTSQLTIIKEKQEDLTMCVGSLYCKKITLKNPTLKDFIAMNECEDFNFRGISESKSFLKIIQLNLSNVMDFRFSINIDETPSGIILTEDRGMIIPDDNNEIGFLEIKNAFIAMPGVTPRLIPEGWIENHYKMILLKFSWMEKQFPKVFADKVCLPENLLPQLKYRYDRDVEKKHQSCIKKLLRGTENVSKSMVLTVLDIIENGKEENVEIVLSDRWYSLNTIVDSAMKKLINYKKVRIGMKLIIQNAELINFNKEYSDPLRIPSDLKLKIHTNSVKPAKVHTKLGFINILKPITTHLEDIFKDGGIVANLKIRIVRKYRPQYSNPEGMHSELVERRKLINNGMAPRKILRRIGITEDTSGTMDLIRSYSELKEFVEEHHAEKYPLLLEFEQECRNHYLKYFDNKSKRILVFRVVDVIYPTTSALLIIQNPSNEDVSSLFKENIPIKVTNLIANGNRDGTLELHTCEKTEYQILSNQMIKPVPHHMKRIIYTIGRIRSSKFNPAFREFDTFGFIVKLSRKAAGRYESVYLADYQQRIIRIDFQKSIEEYALEDVIKPDICIAARNLRIVPHDKAKCVLELRFLATNLSQFTTNPQSTSMHKALEKCKERFRDIDLHIFKQACLRLTRRM